MNPANQSGLPRNRGAGAFLERLRKALAHDLRSPLGTIANYAAILEFHESANPEDVRAFAGRIRSNAARLADMLQELADATVLSERALQWTEVDASGVLRAQLAELGLHARYPARGSEPEQRVPFDAALLAFAWRAFLDNHHAVSNGDALDLDLAIDSDADGSTIEMWVGSQAGEGLERIDSLQYSLGVPGKAPAEPCFALGLAEELFHAHGGEFALWGRPGAVAGLRVGLPRAD